MVFLFCNCLSKWQSSVVRFTNCSSLMTWVQLLSPLLQPLNQSCCCILPDQITVQFHYTAITLSLLFGHFSGLFPTPYRLKNGSLQQISLIIALLLLQPYFKTFFSLPLPYWADINKTQWSIKIGNAIQNLKIYLKCFSTSYI